jgi:hypothetical protein
MEIGHTHIPAEWIDLCKTGADRHRLIAIEAFLRAKARGFGPGRELEDWLLAERDVNAACGLIEPEPRWDL